MRSAARFTSTLPLLLVLAACGGPSKPVEAPDPSKAQAESDAPAVDPTKPDAPPKSVSKYPEPFLEPDCATVPADGYLPDAKKVVSEVRKAHWSQLLACAEAAPPGEDVSGEVRTSFRLDPDGVPRCVEAPGSSMAHKDVVNCVVSVYRSFRFPPPKNGSVRVTDGIHLDVAHEDE